MEKKKKWIYLGSKFQDIDYHCAEVMVAGA